jgi:hypothetical protein
MRRHLTVAVLAAATAGTSMVPSSARAAAVCDAAGNCPAPVPADGYRIAHAAVPDAVALRAALGGDSSHRSIDAVLDAANRPMSALSTACRPVPDGLSPKAASGFCWNDEDQGGSTDFTWYPQGITTTADAADAGEYDNARAIAVTWYKRRSETDHTAVQARVSLAPAGGAGDGNGKYRHVLLVRPDGADNFAHVACHAGGAMWYGNLLYVACTNRIRVFDWNYLHEVKTSSLPGEGFGRQSDGQYYANGNRYVLVQVGEITNPAGNVRFSSLSLDRLSTPDRMVVSRYSESVGVNLWRFDLDATTRLPTSGVAVDAYELPFTLVQGATTRGDRFWFNSSGSSPRLRYWHRTAGQEPVAYAGVRGAESLSYWPSGDGPGAVPDYLYTLTEHRGEREVFALRQGDFDG